MGIQWKSIRISIEINGKRSSREYFLPAGIFLRVQVREGTFSMESPAGLENVIRGGSSEIYSIGKGYGKILARTSHAAHRAFMRRALGSIVIHSQSLPFQRFAGTHRVGSNHL